MCKILKSSDKKDDMSYKREVHPNNRKFWKDLPKHPEHALGRHPVFTLGGEELDRASYKHTKGLSDTHKVKDEQLPSLFMQMINIEHAHKKQLEELAVEAVAKMMKVDKSELVAKITDDVDVNETEPLEHEEMKALPQNLLDEANKRITSNAFSQGASVHAYLTAHFFEDIQDKIKKIDPKLTDIYSKISVGSHKQYWTLDMSAMGLGNAAVGSVRPEQDKDGSIKMEAKAPVFIVLVQELVKGVLELRYLKGLQEKSSEELSDEDIKKIFQYADKIEDEPRLIQIGPELWRRFLKVLNNSKVKGTKSPVEVYEHLMKLPPKDLHKFVQLVVEEQDKAPHELELLLEDDNKIDFEQLLKDIENPEDIKFSAGYTQPMTAPAPTKTVVPTKQPYEVPGKNPRVIPLPQPKNNAPTTAPVPTKTPTPTKQPYEVPGKKPRVIPLPQPKNLL